MKNKVFIGTLIFMVSLLFVTPVFASAGAVGSCVESGMVQPRFTTLDKVKTTFLFEGLSAKVNVTIDPKNETAVDYIDLTVRLVRESNNNVIKTWTERKILI